MKVKVRIAVAVDVNGDWGCSGWRNATPKDWATMMDLAAEDLEQGEARYWLTAELDTPGPAREVVADVAMATDKE